jgi:hypothetical protein
MMHKALASDINHNVVSDRAVGHEQLGQLRGTCCDGLTLLPAFRSANIDGLFHLEATVGQRPSMPPDGLLYLHRDAAFRTGSRFAHDY